MAENIGRVLLVDDEDLDRDFMRRALEHQGYTVLEADNYTDALRIFREHPVNILVTDISMPGTGNGCELALLLLRSKPDLRVLFVSGYVGFEICKFYGIPVTSIHFLRKPFTAQTFLSRFRQLMESREPFPKFRSGPRKAVDPDTTKANGET